MATTTTSSQSLRRQVYGAVLAAVLMGVLVTIMLALRTQLGEAAVALVLLLPVVGGVLVGDLWVGIGTAVVGALLYDILFIPPYDTLSVAAARGWIALVTYVVIAAILGRVVTRLRAAEQAAREREADTTRLLELSELLIEDRPLAELLSVAVSLVCHAFGSDAAVLLLPKAGSLQPAAQAGRQLSPDEIALLTPAPGIRGPAGAGSSLVAPETETVVLVSGDRPVGVLVLTGTRFSAHQRTLVAGFANHLAGALERAQLQEQAMRAQVLEDVDRLRSELVGAVSHDLRTPLASIRAAISTLLDSSASLGPSERSELLTLIATETDRLARLVTNLLDMSRIEAGALRIESQALDVRDLAIAAVRSVGASASAVRAIKVEVPPSLPAVHADHVLVEQVLVNLLENSLRYAPVGSEVLVEAHHDPDGMVTISVSDKGPGLPADVGISLFETSGREQVGPSAGRSTGAASSGGGSGLGLSIAKAFVEALGGRIWAANATGPGAIVSFTLPAAMAGAPESSTPAAADPLAGEADAAADPTASRTAS